MALRSRPDRQLPDGFRPGHQPGALGCPHPPGCTHAAVALHLQLDPASIAGCALLLFAAIACKTAFGLGTKTGFGLGSKPQNSCRKAQCEMHAHIHQLAHPAVA